MLAAPTPPLPAPEEARREELERLEHATAELIDEVVFREGEAEKWRRCAEAFVDYTVELERCVVLPALGSLAAATESHRAAAVGQAEALSAASPRMARVLPMLRAPPPDVVRREHRDRLVAAPPGSLEDGFALLQGALEAQERLKVLLAEGTVAASPALDPDGEVKRLLGENATLREQLEIATARNEARGKLAAREEELLESRLESVARQLALAERTVEEQRQQLRAADSTAELYRQAQQERALLVERIAALEDVDTHASAPPGSQLRANEQTIVELRRHIATLEGRLESAAQNGGEIESRTQLRALELTVAALNGELGDLEQRAVETEAQHCAEREQWARAQTAKQAHHERELQECDQVVSNLATELEQAMAENDALRRQLSA